MTLKLNGSTDGSVSIDAPADTSPSGTDVTLTLPTSAGSSGQYLQTNGSGTLSWQTVATPTVAFESYAVISDEKASNQDGGTFTSGDWRTRDLNNEVADPDSIVSISSNQFTLGAGSYLIRWSAPGYECQLHQSGLYNVASSGFVEFGVSQWAFDSATTYSAGSGRVTITANTAFEIRHRCSSTKTGNGFGVGGDSGGSTFGAVKPFTIVEIFKEA